MKWETVSGYTLVFTLALLFTFGGGENEFLKKKSKKFETASTTFSFRSAARLLLKSALNDEKLQSLISAENEAETKLDSAEPGPKLFRGRGALNRGRGALTHGRGANGGFQCATCVILLGLVERWSVVNNASVDVNLAKFCDLVPGKVQYLCRFTVKWFGPMIVHSLVNKHSPESICHSLNLCRMDDPTQPQCSLFHKGRRKGISKSAPKYKDFDYSVKKNREILRQVTDGLRLESPHFLGFSLCDLPYVKRLCTELERIFLHHVTANDKDGDSFSTTKTLRGSSWRGRDCNDDDPETYPGRRPRKGDADRDSNCNGIHGKPDGEDKTYEEKFCDGTRQFGIVMLGDSAGAHFHMPEAWFDPTQLNDAALTNGSFVIENEGDWPQLSSSTGYLPASDFAPFITGPVDSIYKRLRARNRCVHRDFQNLSVNGANSNDTLINMRLLRRNATEDHPLVVFYAMNGNDVCNWHHDTIPYMSSTKVMVDNLMKTVEFLNATVPRGSHLVVIGMPDGRFLWNNVHHRIHPIGRLWQDVRYEDMYGFWNCLELSPCYGWLNGNETIRNLTQDRADNITLALRQTVKEQHDKWLNLDISMEESPIFDVTRDWVDVGGKVWQLIEPVDGFHPNQYAMALFGRSMWNKLKKNHPDLLYTNPHNDKIDALFGDQGGY